MRTFLKSVYQHVHSRLPAGIAESLSSAVAVATNKPYVYFDERVHPGGKPPHGSVTFSLDFEMAWAWQYARIGIAKAVEFGLRERAHVPLILGLFEEFGVPSTWATVGHLFLDSCARNGRNLPHPHLPRPPHFESAFWSFPSGDWYQNDPCSSVDKDPAWYAPDLIELLASAKSGHEIACHGFSHMGFGSYCPDEVAAAEIQECVRVMALRGIRASSMVFPGNEAGKLQHLHASGVSGVRSFPESWAEITLPVRDKSGLWCVQGSICLEAPTDRSSAPKRVSLLRRYIDRAVATRMNVHIWFHPSIPHGQLETVLRPTLQYCAELREAGVLDVLTMAQLVAQAERRSVL